MSTEAKFVIGPTSPVHDFFQLMFESTDVVSSYWQPLFKGVGRWQLEVAQLGAKQGQAMIELGHSMARSTNPMSAIEAQMRFWQQLGSVYSDSGQHMAQSFMRAAQPPAGIELFPAPKKRTHDILRLEEWAPHSDTPPERRVA